MTTPKKLLKAKLREISWSERQQVREQEHEVDVQFNPETLKVSFANQKSGGDQSGGAATQFVGQGTTRLAFDLWFDVTAPEPNNQTERDVRKLTEKVLYFIKPKPGSEENRRVAPGVRFSWGTYLFEGTMDSINETLEYFSEDGYPLRAQLSVTLSQQEIQIQYGQQTGAGRSAGRSPGTRPRESARDGDTVQSKAGDKGRQDRWQDDALRNGIENPRHPQVGQLLDMSKPSVPFANPSLGISPPSTNEIRRPASPASPTAAPRQLPIES